jgi:hypothetical protein
LFCQNPEIQRFSLEVQGFQIRLLVVQIWEYFYSSSSQWSFLFSFATQTSSGDSLTQALLTLTHFLPNPSLAFKEVIPCEIEQNLPLLCSCALGETLADLVDLLLLELGS